MRQRRVGNKQQQATVSNDKVRPRTAKNEENEEKEKKEKKSASVIHRDVRQPCRIVLRIARAKTS
jgi:hypothetical protein